MVFEIGSAIALGLVVLVGVAVLPWRERELDGSLRVWRYAMDAGGWVLGGPAPQWRLEVRVQCVWCRIWVDGRGPTGPVQVSYGMCGACETARLIADPDVGVPPTLDEMDNTG